MSKPSLSVNIITKDQPGALDTMLASVYEHVYEDGDEVIVVDTGSTSENADANRSIVEQYAGAKFYFKDFCEPYEPLVEKWLPEKKEEFLDFYKDGKLILDFAAARNYALSKSSKDLIFWLDTDDKLVEPISGQLREAIDHLMDTENPKVDALFLDYLYAFDESDGSCITILRRERVFWRERYHWVGRCHETAVPKEGISPPPRPVAYLESLQTKIQHTEARKPSQHSDVRNYVILMKELEESKIPDPRTIFYLANASRGLRRFKQSVDLYRRFDTLTGSEDDHFAAWYYVASIYLDQAVQRPHDAMDAYYNCIRIKPHDPRGFFGIARCYAALKRWATSLEWYDRALPKKIADNNMHSFDPTHIDYHPHVLATICARELDQPEMVVEFANRALKSRPEYKESKELWQMAQNYVAAHGLQAGFKSILTNLKHGGPNAQRIVRELTSELTMIPPELEKKGIGKPEPPDLREGGSTVAFFCGHTTQHWGPYSSKQGIGGSEKMVMLLSRALQKKGVNVSVYANVPYEARGLDQDGVNWRHWSEFDTSRKRDVLVAWRSPQNVLAVTCPAKIRLIWCHDVQNAAAYTEEVLAVADYVQVQSEAHAGDIRGTVPEEKIWVARNAIELLPEVKTKRDPFSVVFCSSPDRGLLTAAEVVARARQVEPRIQLHVTYGFPEWAREVWAQNQYRIIPDLGYEASVDVYERQVYQVLDSIDAKVYHRVGFDKMYELLSSSGIWLYPTRFCEISCMSAMEAQYAGAVPLATRHHALKETILPEANSITYEMPVPPQNLKDYQEWLTYSANQLIKLARNPPKTNKMRKAAAKAFNVDGLADMWIDKLGLIASAEAVGGSQGNKVAQPCQASKLKV